MKDKKLNKKINKKIIFILIILSAITIFASYKIVEFSNTYLINITEDICHNENSGMACFFHENNSKIGCSNMTEQVCEKKEVENITKIITEYGIKELSADINLTGRIYKISFSTTEQGEYIGISSNNKNIEETYCNDKLDVNETLNYCMPMDGGICPTYKKNNCFTTLMNITKYDIIKNDVEIISKKDLNKEWLNNPNNCKCSKNCTGDKCDELNGIKYFRGTYKGMKYGCSKYSCINNKYEVTVK